MFGRIIDSYEKHQYLAVGYWQPSLDIFHLVELKHIIFDGKAILAVPWRMSTDRLSDFIYQGIYDSKTWDEIVALPQKEVIKSFYQEDIIEDYMDRKFSAPRRKLDSQIALPKSSGCSDKGESLKLLYSPNQGKCVSKCPNFTQEIRGECLGFHDISEFG